MVITWALIKRNNPHFILNKYLNKLKVLLYAWFSCTDFAASGRWCVVMNFSVHAFMYTYYGFRALHFKIPKWVNIAITSMQIIQMVFGVYINVSAYLLKRNGGSCDISDENLNFAFLMYLSYLILFSNFFYHSYLSPSKRVAGSDKTPSSRPDTLQDKKKKESITQRTSNQLVKKYILWSYKKLNWTSFCSSNRESFTLFKLI